MGALGTPSLPTFLPIIYVNLNINWDWCVRKLARTTLLKTGTKSHRTNTAFKTLEVATREEKSSEGRKSLCRARDYYSTSLKRKGRKEPVGITAQWKERWEKNQDRLWKFQFWEKRWAVITALNLLQIWVSFPLFISHFSLLEAKGFFFSMFPSDCAAIRIFIPF